MVVLTSVPYSVTDLAWHPNSQLIVTASTDLKCRVFAAYIADVDGVENSGPFPQLAPFGEPMAEFDHANAWVNAVAWSPQGTRLAFVGHGSSLHVVDFGSRKGEAPTIQSLRFQQLPMSRICFLSNEALVGAGHDCNLHLFSTNASGFWGFNELLDKKRTTAVKRPSTDGFSAGTYLYSGRITLDYDI